MRTGVTGDRTKNGEQRLCFEDFTYSVEEFVVNPMRQGETLNILEQEREKNQTCVLDWSGNQCQSIGPQKGNRWAMNDHSIIIIQARKFTFPELSSVLTEGGDSESS